ncbi:MAG: hypothetical protein ACOYT4_04325 [Nanoarchaeota archaeon]
MNTDDILKKYGSRIEKEMSGFNSSDSTPANFSKSYQEFKESMAPSFSKYEKWCKAFGNLFKVNVAEKDRKRLEKQIAIAHLNLTPSDVIGLAVSIMFLTLFGGILLVLAIWLLTDSISFLMIFLLIVLSLFLLYYLNNMPAKLAQQWRLKASSQMVPAILYIVIYMKHTSNFEKAIAFASEHLQPPLALDFKKIFWDVEIGKYSTIKESLDNYLETWRDYSIEFIESFHLIESSLYEPSEQRRIVILEKSLQVILDGVYDKMLKYTHEVKSPLTNLYMLGIVLPTLALTILPLASTMLQGALKWYHVFLIFNVIVPFLVLYLTNNVMLSRPGGYGDASLLEKNPLYPQYKTNKYYIIAILCVLPLLILGLVPVFWRYTNLPIWLNMKRDYSWRELGLGFLGDAGVFGIIETETGLVGPSGILSLILSLFVPLSIAFMFIIVYKMKTHELIQSRNKYKEVEQEFVSSLFQLGNRMGDGTPAEIAFAKVAQSSKGTATEGFFKTVNENIQQLGMSLNDALFNSKRGAVIYYPSELIETSMKILVESVKKGLNVAARSLMSISDYLKNIKKINDRLNDLLADIVSDMKSNMTFLAPLLSGIIIGLAGMMTAILIGLSAMFQGGMGEGIEEVAGAGGLQTLLGIFDVTKMIPPYWLQIVVGLYLIEIVFILTDTLVTISSGRDELQTTSETGKNLKTAILLYFVVGLISVVCLSLLGSIVLRGLT